MKKYLALIIAVLVVVGVFAACGKTEEKAELTTEANEVVETEAESANEEGEAPEFPYLIINNEKFCVTCAEGFDNSGVSTYICDATADYTFLADGDDATWSIYVLDEKFEDGARYLSQAKQANLVGNGILSIKEGQYVYVACSINAFTADKADDDYLKIGYADGLSGEYQDSYSQRATALVIDDSDEEEEEIFVQINWGSSATENTCWTMECEKTADGKYVYDDCEKAIITYDENGNDTAKTEYEDGEGYFTLKDGKLLWNGASEESCKECVFEK